jgi:hypothetical protein
MFGGSPRKGLGNRSRDLVKPGSGLQLTEPKIINDAGGIVLVGLLPNGDVHSVVHIPCEGDHPTMRTARAPILACLARTALRSTDCRAANNDPEQSKARRSTGRNAGAVPRTIGQALSRSLTRRFKKLGSSRASPPSGIAAWSEGPFLLDGRDLDRFIETHKHPPLR